MWLSTAATTDSKRDRQRADEHDSLDEILGVIGDIEHRQAIEDDADEDRADDGAQNIGVTFVENGKADQRRRDAIEQQRRSREDIAGADRRAMKTPPSEARTPDTT